MLLFTYPRDFRLRFESELVATFSDLVGDEWEQKGLAGIARLWRSALAGLSQLRTFFGFFVLIFIVKRCVFSVAL